MKLSLNIEFDNWEEYLEFSSVMQKQFGKAVSKQNPVKVSKKPAKTPKAKKYASKPEMPKVDGFIPPEDMIQKVNQYLESGQPFRTKDVVSKSIMNNPNRRAKANKWLQTLPGLMFSHQKTEGERGRGPLIYTPIRFEDGKMVLPPGESRSKTDWPIKGASYRMSYKHPMDEPDGEDLLPLDEEQLQTV